MAGQEDVMILQYLRNIAAKMSVLFDRMNQLQKRVDCLGKACSEAFGQCKEVIQKLAEGVEETRMDLSEYGGVIQESTWT